MQDEPMSQLEREIMKEQIEAGIESGTDKLRGRPEEKETFHNTKHLLKQYRRVEYAVRVAEDELSLRSEADYGISLSPLQVNAELAGIDLSGTRIEGYTRSVVRSRKILGIIQRSLEQVRDDPDRGEELYEVLYQTYFSPRKPKSRDEILIALSEKGYHMSLSQYYILLRAGIKAIDRILWGYTTRECLDFVESLFRD